VPATNSDDWNGYQNMALDVRHATQGGDFEFRLRRLYGGCPGNPTTFQIHIETNSGFNEVDIQNTEVAMTPGYLGNTAGWKFPVANERFKATTNGLFINNNGHVGIGTINPKEMLSVKGTILAQKVKVSVSGTDWPDYVFATKYKLRSLSSLESFIKQYNHLPGVPSAKEVESNGVDLVKTQAALLAKIEELTLYVIKQGKEISKLKAQNRRRK
jgi:hypothetical protein